MMLPLFFLAANISKMSKDAKVTKDGDPYCILKSRFSAAQLRDIVLGLKDPQRNIIACGCFSHNWCKRHVIVVCVKYAVKNHNQNFATLEISPY
jgi:hypothetical protein